MQSCDKSLLEGFKKQKKTKNKKKRKEVERKITWLEFAEATSELKPQLSLWMLQQESRRKNHKKLSKDLTQQVQYP